MANFPNISVPSSITETDLSFRLKETSSAGHTMIRGRGTAIKKSFELEWESITSADKNTLQAFFATNYGTSLTWAHFESSVVYTVHFEADDLSFNYLSPGWWKLKLKLRET